MIADPDHPCLERCESIGVEIADMARNTVVDGKIEHLIEIAVVQGPVPPH
jgi:hypothetical protein